MRILHTTLAATLTAVLAGCSGDGTRDAGPREALAALDALAQPPGDMTMVYPADQAVFPPGIPAPTFRWQAPAVPNTLRWAVRVQLGEEQQVFSSSTRQWKPPSSTWARMKEYSRTCDAVVTVAGFPPHEPGSVACAAMVRIRTSADPVGAPIVYRDVPLPFIYAVKNPDTIRWRLADTSSDRPPPVILENLPVCGNCHSFDSSGSVIGMDVDYANDKGSYAIAELENRTVLSRDGIITWSDYRREDGEHTFGLLSQISPDGRYVISTVKDRSVFVPRPDLRYSQLFFPIRGILAVYDRRTGRFSSLPGADDPAFVQSNPAWSPDGKWVYFCRAVAAQIPEDEQNRAVLITEHLARHFLESHREFKYDIYRIPFNGGRGGVAEALPGAAANGKSNYFPRLSPDGKWLVFCMAENFMLLQPDSKLYIMPAAGGRPRLMHCNTGEMNSWHSWSPNGKWLVFSTKAHGAYTQLCLTHIDADGNDTPPILIEHASLPNRACNIPEFLNRRPGAALALREDFLDSLNFRRQGQVLLLAGDYRESIALFDKALELDPDNHEARLRLAVACARTDLQSRADTEFRILLDKLGSDPDANSALLYDVHCHMAQLSRRQSDPEAAARHYRSALRYKPSDTNARIMLGLVLASGGSFDEAEQTLLEAVRLEPDNPLARMWLGMVVNDRGRAEDGAAHMAAALQLSPREQSDWLLMAQRILPYAGLAEPLARFLRRYSAAYPDCPQANILTAKILLNTGNTNGALIELQEALRKDPSLSWIPAKIAELTAPPPTVKR